MSVVFAPTSDRIDLNSGDLDSLDAQSKLTVAFFAKVTTNADFKAFFAKISSATSRVTIQSGGSGQGDSNELLAQVSDGSTFTGRTNAANVLTLNTWRHLAMVFDGTGATDADKLKLYVDGVGQTLTFSGTAPTATPNNAAQAYIGASGINSGTITGKMAEFAIWQGALTSTQIGDLAGGDKPDTIPTNQIVYAELFDDVVDAYGITMTNNGADIDSADHPTMNGSGASTLTAAAGSFTETGVAATLRAARKLSASAASFSLTGQAVTLTGPGAKTLTAAAGSFTLTGQDIALEVAVEAAIASFTLTGQAAGLSAGRRLAASAGSFALTGQAAMLARTRALATAAGSFSLLGNVVALTFSGAAALTGPGDATLANSGASVTLSNRP